MLGQFVRKSDMFAALPTLRVKREPEFLSLCGGIFSIILMIVFTFSFVTGMIAIIQLKTITASQLIKNHGQDEMISDIHVGVGLYGYNLTALAHIFTVVGYAFTKEGSIVPEVISMHPCTRQDFPGLSEQDFISHSITTSYCPDPQKAFLKGFMNSHKLNFFMLAIKQCNNLTSSVVCASEAQITAFYTAQRAYGKYMIASVIFQDTLFNPTNQIPASPTINENFLWLAFTQTSTLELMINVAKWTVSTDTSFLPFQNKEQITGNFAYDSFNFVSESDDNTDCIVIYFFASKNKKIINRLYGKFDALLSYLGGLFSLILAFFGFFALSYNQYKYELWVSEGSFTLKNGHRVHERDMHFLKYIKYSIYDWVGMLFNLKPNWEDCRSIQQAREEAIEQIEVQHLLRRINHLENKVNTMMKSEESDVICLMEPSSIETMRRNRKIHEYYTFVTENSDQLTIHNAKMALQIYAFARDFTLQKDNVQGKPISEMNSFELMDRFLGEDTYENSLKWNAAKQLPEQLQSIENDEAESLYAIEEEKRMEIIERIPLSVLYRLRRNKRKQRSQNLNLEATNITQLFVRPQEQNPKLFSRHPRRGFLPRMAQSIQHISPEEA